MMWRMIKVGNSKERTVDRNTELRIECARDTVEGACAWREPKRPNHGSGDNDRIGVSGRGQMAVC